MAAEKFFEHGGRPIDVERASDFLNSKPEEDAQSESSTAVSSALPSPASASQKSKSQLSAAMIIPIWIALSSSVIIYNNYLYNTLNFKFPVFLVTYHLGFAVRPPHHLVLDLSSKSSSFLCRLSAHAY